MIEKDGVGVSIDNDTVTFSFISDEAKNAYRQNKEYFQEELGRMVNEEVQQLLVNNTKLKINRNCVSALYIIGDYAISHFKKNNDSWRLNIITLLNAKKIPFVYVMFKHKKRPSSSDQTTN